MAKLGDVCTVVSGTTPKSSCPDYWNGTINWVTPAELADDSDTIFESQRKITELAVSDSGLKPFPAGTVLLSSRAPIGKVAIAGQEMYCNQGFKNLVCSDAIYNRYLFHFLKSKTDYLNSLGRGATFKEISKSIVEQIEIPLPSLDEQRRIAAVLDKVTDLIAQRRAQLDKLDLLVKSRFVEMFEATGKQVPLADYVWFQEGPGVRSVDFTEEGTVLLTGSNINNNIITFGHKSDRHISNELANGKYKHFMCDKDDILVVSSAIDPDKFDKKVVIVDSNKKYCLNTGIIRFKPDKKFLTLGYFREFLKTDYFKHQVSSEMRGIAQMHFGPSHLRRMTILLPDSLEKQIEFSSFIQQTDKSKLTIHKSLDKLETMKRALMQQYFREA